MSPFEHSSIQIVPLRWLLRMVAVLRRVGKMASTVGSVNSGARKDIPSPSSPCIRYYRQCSQCFQYSFDHLDCFDSDDAFGFFADGSD